MKTAKRMTPAGRRVLEVASRLFHEHGINTIGMDRLAEEAGVTKKTIYDRFGSKADLVAAYLGEKDRRFRAFTHHRIDAEPDARAKILATYDALGAWIANIGTTGCAFVKAAAELADPGHPGRLVVTAEKRWLRGLYAQLAAEAGADATTAEALFILNEGAVIAFTLGGDQDAAAHARAAAERLLATTGDGMRKT